MAARVGTPQWVGGPSKARTPGPSLHTHRAADPSGPCRSQRRGEPLLVAHLDVPPTRPHHVSPPPQCLRFQALGQPPIPAGRQPSTSENGVASAGLPGRNACTVTMLPSSQPPHLPDAATPMEPDPTESSHPRPPGNQMAAGREPSVAGPGRAFHRSLSGFPETNEVGGTGYGPGGARFTGNWQRPRGGIPSPARQAPLSAHLPHQRRNSE